MVNNSVTVRVRRCSFCRCPNHNILSCNHTLILQFQNNLFYKKNEITGMLGISLFEKIALLESWILYQCVMGNSFLIKAYSVRYLNCTMRDRTNTCIKKISDFIWENEIIHGDGETQNSEEIEIEWFFDRSGDPNLLPSNSDLNSDLNSNLTTNVNILVEVEVEVQVEVQVQEFESEFKLQECSICYESIEKNNMVKINCAHEFCGFCIKKIMNSDIKNCAFCREKIHCIKVKSLEMEKILLSSNVN